jgi:hypothetical protein
MHFNAAKTVSMCFSKRPIPSSLGINFQGMHIRYAETHVHLGLTFSQDLKFNQHVNEICRKTSRELVVLRILKRNLPPNSTELLLKLYKAYIRSHLEYCAVILSGIGKTLADNLEKIQRKAIRIMLDIPYRSPVAPVLYEQLSLDTLQFRRNCSLSCFGYKLCKSLCPRALTEYRPVQRVTPYVTRRANYVLNPAVAPTGLPSAMFKRSSIYLAPRLLNVLRNDCVSLYPSITRLKTYLKTLRTDANFCDFPF